MCVSKDYLNNFRCTCTYKEPLTIQVPSKVKCVLLKTTNKTTLKVHVLV